MFKKFTYIFSMLLLINFCVLSQNVSYAKSISKEDKKQAQEFYLTGLDSYKNNQVAQAAQYFMEAVKIDKENALYNVLAGDMLRLLKQYPSALRYYETASDNSKKNNDLNKKISLRILTGQSLIYSELKEYDKAISFSEQATKDFNDNYKSFYSLGLVYSKKGTSEDDLKAIENFNKSIDLNKEQVESYIGLVDIYKKTNSTNKIIDTYKKAVEYRPLDENFKMALAQTYFTYKNKENYLNAINSLNDILNVNPNNAYAHYYLSIAYTLIGEKNLAENELGIVNGLNPNLGERLNKELTIHYKKNKNKPTEEVIDTFENTNYKLSVKEKLL